MCRVSESEDGRRIEEKGYVTWRSSRVSGDEKKKRGEGKHVGNGWEKHEAREHGRREDEAMVR